MVVSSYLLNDAEGTTIIQLDREFQDLNPVIEEGPVICYQIKMMCSLEGVPQVAMLPLGLIAQSV